MPDMIIHNIANYLHILASTALLMKIWTTQDCAGVSGKSQFLYMLVYTTRYLDLFTTYISEMNTVIKIIYLALGYCTALSIFVIFRKSYEKKYDTFRIERLIIPCLAVAMIVNHSFDAIEVIWMFSIYLEAVAMIPQFQFIAKAKYIHKHIFYYILILGTYKALYIAHWIYRYYQEAHYDRLTEASGIVQFLLYCDFFIRVLPKLDPKNAVLESEDDSDDTEDEKTTDTVSDATVENGDVLKNGHLSCNISTIVLTPASLLIVSNDKENLLKSEDPISKS